MEDGDVVVTFEEIANSQKREFVFRFITLSDDVEPGSGWLPPSGHLQMLYKKPSNALVAGGVS